MAKEQLSAFLSQVAPPAAGKITDLKHTPAAAGAAFAAEWLGSSEPHAAIALLAERPRIPTPLDAELMRSVETMIGVSLRDNQAAKREVRRAFWDAIEAGRSPAD